MGGGQAGPIPGQDQGPVPAQTRPSPGPSLAVVMVVVMAMVVVGNAGVEGEVNSQYKRFAKHRLILLRCPTSG